MRQTHPHDHLADLQGVVILNLRQIQRQDEHGAVQPHPQSDIGQAAEQEIALLEQPQVDQMIVPRQLQNDEDHQADKGDGGQQSDLSGFEPVLTLTFFQKHLQTAQADGHAQDAGIVAFLQQLPARFALIQPVQQAQGHQHTGDDVDVEDVFPAVVLGQPAADGRADGRREGGGDGEQRHALGTDIQGQLGEHQREGEGNQRAAGQPLQHPEQDHAFQIPGHRTQQRGDNEGDGYAYRKASWRHDHRQPRRQRNDDDLGHQIGGRYPRAFFNGGRQCALDVLERRVDDLDIQNGHEGAENGAENGNPIAAGWRWNRLCLGRFSHAGRP